MDIKKIVEDIVDKLQSDDGLKDLFMKDPVSALEKLTGIDLPNDQLDGVVAAVKAKLGAADLGDKLKGLGGLFKK